MIRFFYYLSVFLGLLVWPGRAAAHQLDEYLQGTFVAIEPGEIRLQMNLTPGVAVAEKMLGLIDRNHDGIISTNETVVYAELLKRDLVVRLDGREVELKPVALNFPEPAEIRTGWGIILIDYAVKSGEFATGPHTLTFENRHQSVASVYLLNAARPRSASVEITGQKRNENQSTGEIAFNFHPPPGSAAKAGLAVWLTPLLVFMAAATWLAKRKQKSVREGEASVEALARPSR